MRKISTRFLVMIALSFIINSCRPSPLPTAIIQGPTPPTTLTTTEAGSTQLSVSDQVATFVAATMQALPSNTPSARIPDLSAELLPHALYYLGNDGVSFIAQVYRLDTDGKTITQLTSEPNCKGVDGYDLSPIDGTIAFVSDNQLLLINADGSNRRLLVDGGHDTNDPCNFKTPLSNPVFSPDGRTIVYHHQPEGLYFYDVASSISNLVLMDQWADPMPNGMRLPIETYMPVSYSPDGTKLLLAIGQWEAPPATAVYHPDKNVLVRIEEQPDDLSCCSQHGGPVWSWDSSSFYGVAIPLTFCCQTGELWKVDAGNGSVIRSLKISFEGGETFDLPKELYLAPDGQLYFFFGTYRWDSGFSDAQVLNIVRSAPDGETDRAILGEQNFILMNEALWAPDASLVIVATASRRESRVGGILELYYTNGQNNPVWLAPFGQQLKWGP